MKLILTSVLVLSAILPALAESQISAHCMQIKTQAFGMEKMYFCEKGVKYIRRNLDIIYAPPSWNPILSNRKAKLALNATEKQLNSQMPVLHMYNMEPIMSTRWHKKRSTTYLGHKADLYEYDATKKGEIRWGESIVATDLDVPAPYLDNLHIANGSPLTRGVLLEEKVRGSNGTITSIFEAVNIKQEMVDSQFFAPPTGCRTAGSFAEVMMTELPIDIKDMIDSMDERTK